MLRLASLGMTIFNALCVSLLLAGCGDSALSPGSSGSPDEPDAGALGDADVHPRGACSFGHDCLCDRLASDPSIAFCEDFENPGYNGFPAERSGYADGNPFALAYNAVNFDEGTCSNCGYNIVTPADGQCDVPGETDCVLDGAQAFGHRFVPGQTGGIVAEKSFQVGSTFGITYAFKFSSNFVDPSVALKTNELGARNQSCLLGCSTGNAGGRNVPFSWALVGAFQQAEVVVGHQERLDVGIAFGVDKAQYEWRGSKKATDDPDKVVNAPGHWACQQVHFRNWGTDHAELRTWINGKLVLHIRGLDMRGMRGPDGQRSPDLDNVGYLALNHYFNGGYPGAAPAYRYEDNIVVTTADEPVSCGAIGAAAL